MNRKDAANISSHSPKIEAVTNLIKWIITAIVKSTDKAVKVRHSFGIKPQIQPFLRVNNIVPSRRAA